MLNPLQERFNRLRRLRNLILKARQQGFSTYILGLFLLACLVEDNTTAVIISHEKKATQKLLARVKFMFQHLPLPVTMQYDSKDEMTFPETNSSLYIGTAGSRSFGRGDTITHLHCSEFGFWPNADMLWTGLREAVTPDGQIFIESTANGIGNQLYDMWMESKQEGSEFAPFFFAWYMFPQYRATTEAIEPLSLSEVELIETAKLNGVVLDRFQLQWRRDKLGIRVGQEPSQKRLLAFLQEYPSDDRSCFLQSGRPVFESKYLKIGCTMKQLPDNGERYVIGGDCAEGKVDGDFNAAYVIKVKTGEQVAAIHGLWTPAVFARKLYELGKLYNWAELGPERNNHGHAVILALQNMNYPNLYLAEDGNYGWLTTGKSKPIMIDQFEEALREGWIKVSDAGLLDECLTFQYNDRGGAEAQKGKHDDRVMAAAIAWQMRQAPTSRAFSSKPQGF